MEYHHCRHVLVLVALLVVEVALPISLQVNIDPSMDWYMAARISGYPLKGPKSNMGTFQR